MVVKASAYTVFLVTLFLLLSACGGGSASPNAGGSSTGNSGNTSGNSNSNVSIAPPAAFNGDNVASITDEVFLAAQSISATAQNLPGTGDTQNVTQTVYGASGQVTITLNLDSNGNGTLTDVYQNYVYKSGNPSESGTITLTYAKHIPTVLQYSDFTVKFRFGTYAYDGQLEVSSLSPLSAVATLTISTALDTFSLSKFSVNSTYTASDDMFTVTIGGVLSDSRIGSVTVTTLSPVNVKFSTDANSEFPDVLPQGTSGEVKLTGADGSTLDITPLNSLFIAVGIDTSGSAGGATEGGRIDRSTGLLDGNIANNSAIEAVAELGADVGQNAPITLDGRYSHAETGLVTYDWKLVASPAGSTVSVSSNTATTSFQPDIAGGYTLGLTVSDGTSSATDYIEVDYPGNTNTDAASMATKFKIPAFYSAQLGTAVTLDARSSPNTTDGTWLLKVPDGSNAVLSSDSGLEPNFTPDVSGTYVLTYCDAPSSGCISPIGYGVGTSSTDVMVVEAGISTPVRFGPMTPIASMPSGFLLSAWSVGNFTGNGRDSFALLGRDGNTGTPEMLIYPDTSDAPGNFSAGQLLTLPGTSIGESIQFADINGDGIPDWVDTDTGDTAYLSGSSGYTTSNVAGGAFAIGSIEGKPALGILNIPVISGYDNLQPEAYLFDESSGSFSSTPIVSTATNPNLRIWQTSGVGLADFDGDKVTDLVAATADASSTDKLWFFKGNGDGTFTFNQSFDLDDYDNVIHSIFITDLYGTGKLDIVVVDGGGWHVFADDGSGNFTDKGVSSLKCDLYDCTIVKFKGSSTPDLIGPPGSSCGTDCPGIYFLLPNTGTLNGTWYSYPTSIGVKVHIGDFNNDGIPDLYLEDGSKIYVMPGLNADGSLP